MIDFTRIQLTGLVGHYVGNKGLGMALNITDKEIDLNDDYTKTTMLQYMLKGFKTDIYYEFKNRSEINLHDVKALAQDTFKYPKNLLYNSKRIAEELYNQTMHPKLAGGELYVAYFRDIVLDGELVDAIGIFKSEQQETFIKSQIVGNDFDLSLDTGCGIDKLDKGVLIFNTDQENGYKLSIINKGQKVNECAFYWTEDFLGARLKDTPYYQTSHKLYQCLGFCEEQLTPENGVNVLDKKMIETKTLNYFKDNDKFVEENYKREVLGQSDELLTAFNDHKNAYQGTYQVDIKDEFDISPTAVKEKKKFERSIIKLDKNFHIYVHGGHEKLEKGYDDDKGMGYYKCYFIHEEI